MKHEIKKALAALLAGALSLSLLSACASNKVPDETDAPTTVQEQTSTDPSEDANSENPGVYDLPTLGLKAVLPDELVKRMEEGSITMLCNEIPTEDGSALQYGYLCWMPMDEGMLSGESFNLDELQNIGMLGVYQAELVGSLDELTGCNEHQPLGESADGSYKYYLSVNTAADQAVVEEIRNIQTTITEMTAYTEDSGSGQTSKPSTGSVGEFTTQDVLGNSITQDIFKEHKLTMVNVFTTWCSPCVAEMPDLEKLHQQMKERDVGVIGVVMDVLDENGNIVDENLERAQELLRKTGVTYPVLLPDATYFNGRLLDIEAYPETFFVDENGNMVGQTYSGSGSLEDWLETVEKELANLEAGA